MAKKSEPTSDAKTNDGAAQQGSGDGNSDPAAKKDGDAQQGDGSGDAEKTTEPDAKKTNDDAAQQGDGDEGDGDTGGDEGDGGQEEEDDTGLVAPDGTQVRESGLPPEGSDQAEEAALQVGDHAYNAARERGCSREEASVAARRAYDTAMGGTPETVDKSKVDEIDADSTVKLYAPANSGAMSIGCGDGSVSLKPKRDRETGLTVYEVPGELVATACSAGLVREPGDLDRRTRFYEVRRQEERIRSLHR